MHYLLSQESVQAYHFKLVSGLHIPLHNYLESSFLFTLQEDRTLGAH